MRTKSKFRHGSSGGADTDDLVALGMCSALAAEAADDLGAARAEATCRQMWVAARKGEARVLLILHIQRYWNIPSNSGPQLPL